MSIAALYDEELQDVARAKRHPLFARLTPRANKILCTRPHRRLSRQVSRTATGLYKPAESARAREEYGLVCTVLAVGDGIDEAIRPGVQILLPQFAGKIVYDLTTGHETELWMVGEGEVMAVLEGSNGHQA